MREKSCTIDLYDESVQEPICFKQNDTSILNVTVLSEGEPANLHGKTIVLSALRPNCTAVIQDADMTVTENTVRIQLDPRIVAVAGIVQSELLLYDGAALISSFRLPLSVAGAVVSDENASPEAISTVKELITALHTAIPTSDVLGITPGHFPKLHEDGYLIDSGYAPEDYAAADHDHDDAYAAIGHTHEGYAAADHTHAGYAAADHTHAQYLTAASLTAYQGKAVDSTYFTANTVTGILDEIGGELDGLGDALGALL